MFRNNWFQSQLEELSGVEALSITSTTLSEKDLFQLVLWMQTNTELEREREENTLRRGKRKDWECALDSAFLCLFVFSH